MPDELTPPAFGSRSLVRCHETVVKRTLLSA